MNGGQTDAPEMAGKHQKMYFSFFKIALFVLPIIPNGEKKFRHFTPDSNAMQEAVRKNMDAGMLKF